MIDRGEDSKLILGYLLGNLTEERRAAFEDRYFADDAFFEEFLIAEDELIDSYVRGTLSAQEQDQFEKNFLATPARRNRVEFAKILLKSPRPTKMRIESDTAGRKSPSWPQSISAFWLQQNRAIRLSTAIAVLIVAVGASWLAIRGLRHPSTVATRQTLSFELVSINVRGNNESQVLNLPQGVKEVELKLYFEPSAHNTYRVALQQSAGAVIWQKGALEAQAFGPNKVVPNKVVVVTLPADLLPGGTYSLTLSGETDRERADLLSEYQFKVVRQ